MSLQSDQLAALFPLRGLPTPTKELRFHETRRWRFDLAWHNLKIAIEYEGGVYVPGTGHSSGKGIERDIEKQNEAQLLGWIVIRCTRNTVKSGEVFVWFERAMQMRSK